MFEEAVDFTVKKWCNVGDIDALVEPVDNFTYSLFHCVIRVDVTRRQSIQDCSTALQRYIRTQQLSTISRLLCTRYLMPDSSLSVRNEIPSNIAKLRPSSNNKSYNPNLPTTGLLHTSVSLIIVHKCFDAYSYTRVISHLLC